MSVSKERRKINRERKKVNNGRLINRDILVISIFFVAIFFALMVYLGIFLTFQSSTVINNTYNKRTDTFKKTVKRGNIYDRNGNILARTDISEDGTETRIYPYGNVFAQTVGFEANGGLGLESSYNYYLLTSHADILEKISNEFNGVKNPGDSIYTTLDADLQTRISDLMGQTAGACIVMDPTTGQFQAVVSKPDFDPNAILENWDAIIADEEGSPLLNRATQGKYTPGSTFKIFTMLEYMRENPAFRDYTYNCEGQIVGENYVISCVDRDVHGYEDLRASFANSCNCSFANMALLLDIDLFRKNNESLLFNSEIDIDIAYNQADFVLESTDSEFMIMQTGFGQGETSSNPLHLSLVMSAFANNGVLMKPHLVTQIVSDSGHSVRQFPDKKYMTLCTSSEAETMNEYLRAVVTEGTANNLNWSTYTAYGKTGTAETLSNKNENFDRSWFVGWAEQDGKKVVVCIVIDNLEQAPMAAVDYAGYVFDYCFH